MNAVNKFLVDFKPDYLIWGGDLGNWQSFSKWEDEDVLTYQTADEFDAVDNVISEHQRICGKKCKYIWLQGNHDEWIGKYCQVTLNYRHKKEYNLQKRLKLKERKVIFVPVNKQFEVGKLRFVHGLYLNEYHAKKTLLAYNNNIIYGHAHTEQSYTYISPVDETQVRVGRSRPCLCNLNPDYLKNRPNAWTHGFSVWYIREDGTFNEYCINITNGVFTFNNQNYDGK